MYSRSRSAFTLIEILVVVAILALLIAVLLPSLSAAKEQSMAVVCKTRMRELFNGHAFYGADHKQRFPHWDSWLWDGIHHQDLQGIKPNGPAATDYQSRVTRGQIYKYVKNKECYFCPKDSKRRGSNAIPNAIHSYSRHFEPHYFALWTKTGTGLGGGTWNAYLAHPDSVDLMTPDMIRPAIMGKAAALHEGVPCNITPNRVGLLFEEWQSADDQLQSSTGDGGFSDLNDAYSAPLTSASDHMTTRHKNRGNILYWDGHIDLVDGKKINMYPCHYDNGSVPADVRYAATVIIGARKN
jgi:prepilin-type processing-associated H-X9-DG protein/prepilin-type N-terminal cleavage/methylation domain-containing protein